MQDMWMSAELFTVFVKRPESGSAEGIQLKVNID